MNDLNDFLRQILFLPPQASSMARSIDTLHYTVIIATMLGATVVFLVALYFVVRYRAPEGQPARVTPKIHAPGWLEALFIIGTLGLFLVWWQVGFAQYVRMTTPPRDALDIYVSAKQWMWRFAYPEGNASLATLYVPAGRPVRLIMTSRDVIHSFFVPDFRIKYDVVPGHYTTIWFNAPEPGRHQILCAEYCGADHSLMRAEVIVMPPAEYARFIHGNSATSMIEQGRLAAARHGCLRCHSVDGSPGLGPTWVGTYGSQRRFTDGSTAVADEAYLTASMMDPARQIVAGFLPIMPTFQGLIPPPEIAGIVEYIKSLSHGPDVTR